MRRARALQTIRRVSVTLASLALAACASKVALSDRMPESALAADEGVVIGSIVLAAPTDVDPEHVEPLAALRGRRLEAHVRRYVLRLGDLGFQDHVGEEYVLALVPDVERRFVLRAPAGMYSILELCDFHPGLFGDQRGCKSTGLASFEVHGRQTTYVGKLVLQVGFKSELEVRVIQGDQRARGIVTSGNPEQWLTLNASTTDAREATLRALATEGSPVPSEVQTELMDAAFPDWGFDPPEPQKVPGSS
jgi:hypothetical protein